ncbi:amino acid ABC transporter substrate-binding protein [Collimonas fungivorans]|uniref:amino acid ABC transporter substrate-binding protein n=1 Tax=Collimonas fungivorans TaxID=158899 RepID=UPI00077873F0|nr:amino acid ABC transporter substrate-binding protein [Collimonas fungivorans]
MRAQITGLIVRTSIFFGLWAFVTSSFAVDTLEKIRDDQTIIIGYRENLSPFSYLDEGKKPIGYAIDLCSKIVEAVRHELKLTQLKVNYIPVTSSNRIPLMIDGKMDLECGATTNNAERRKQIAFTVPHFFASVRMVVKANSGIKNWENLRDKRVVTTTGTTTVKLLTDRDKVRALNLKLIEGKDVPDSFNKVESGEADAFPMDDVLLFTLRAGAKDPGSFNIVGSPLSAEPYAIMMRKDDAPFKALVDREMARIIYSGEMVKLYDKWFKYPIPPKGSVLNMPMSYLLSDSLRFPTDKVGD